MNQYYHKLMEFYPDSLPKVKKKPENVLKKIMRKPEEEQHDDSPLFREESNTGILSKERNMS
ncbi:MAG: hypothetical protein ACUZ8N_14220 [Candidatus Scalindua sp.]